MREVDMLVSKNSIAETEAARLSSMNAEILSHGNPGQRILYVEKIRKELAEVKQVGHSEVNYSHQLTSKLESITDANRSHSTTR